MEGRRGRAAWDEIRPGCLSRQERKRGERQEKRGKNGFETGAVGRWLLTMADTSDSRRREDLGRRVIWAPDTQLPSKSPGGNWMLALQVTGAYVLSGVGRCPWQVQYVLYTPGTGRSSACCWGRVPGSLPVQRDTHRAEFVHSSCNSEVHCASLHKLNGRKLRGLQLHCSPYLKRGSELTLVLFPYLLHLFRAQIGRQSRKLSLAGFHVARLRPFERRHLTVVQWKRCFCLRPSPGCLSVTVRRRDRSAS